MNTGFLLKLDQLNRTAVKLFIFLPPIIARTMNSIPLDNTQLWTALLSACVGTYFCRSVGVILSGRVDQNSEFFYWLTCVTYAMVAAMTVRMIVLPIGLLSTVPLYVRLLVCALTVAIMVMGHKRRLGPALLIGILCLISYVKYFQD